MKASPNSYDHHHHEQGKLFIDPVCGMSTEDQHGFTSHEYEGQSYYFCSDHCLAKFKKNPDEYIAGGPEKSEESEEAEPIPDKQYTCPMHPEIVQDAPGSCPKCGMSLPYRWYAPTLRSKMLALPR